jgi:hypothetical protein
MRETAIQILIVILLISCSKKQDENTYHISEKPEYEVKSEIVFAAEGKDSLNMFYDLVIIDSFVVVTDMVSDTLVRIYKNINFENCLFKGLKGNGNSDFLSPTLINQAIDYDTTVIFEINSRRLKYIKIDSNNKISIIKSEFIPKQIPYPDEFNMTEKYIAGINIDDYNLFIYDKELNKITNTDNYPKPEMEYDNNNLNFLYYCNVIMNQNINSICCAMLELNCINFYNLQGERYKTVIIGDELYFPKPHPYVLGFPDEKENFSGITGTNDYVYCLYRGVNAKESATDVKIFVFNWEGEHITTIKTDGNIVRITADKNNRYILGLSNRENGSTDIVKIPLEGVLKK